MADSFSVLWNVWYTACFILLTSVYISSALHEDLFHPGCCCWSLWTWVFGAFKPVSLNYHRISCLYLALMYACPHCVPEFLPKVPVLSALLMQDRLLYDVAFGGSSSAGQRIIHMAHGSSKDTTCTWLTPSLPKLTCTTHFSLPYPFLWEGFLSWWEEEPCLRAGYKGHTSSGGCRGTKFTIPKRLFCMWIISSWK